MDKARVEKADLQRLVAYSLRTDWVRHVILRVESHSRTRQFISQLMEQGLIADAGDNSDAAGLPWKLNVSFTYLGLRRMELNEAILENTLPTLAAAFVEGPGSRSHAQGDIDESAAHNWEDGFDSNNAHLVLTIYGNDRDSDWDEIVERIRSIDGATGLDGWCNVQLARRREGDREVFGFKDGISQPYFRGVSREPVGPVPETLKFEAGDLLLGYENTVGENFWDDELLPEGARNFFKCGTFAALRKIKQDLNKFNTVTEQLAKENNVEPEFVRAKFFGRWPNGAVVKPGQTTEPETSLEAENDFDFSDDQHGFGCPFGSHIRRINHRNSKDVFPYRHRAIQRRGLPYGGEEGEEEGLLALFICSSLQSQYEFVMGDWVDTSPRMHSGSGAIGSDPIIGNQCNGAKQFDIPMEETESIRLTGLRQFTTTKGMLYLFYPSMTALRRMAILDEESKDYVYSPTTE